MASHVSTLDVLASMAERWEDTTSAMLSVTAAAIMIELGVSTVNVPMGNVGDIVRDYQIDRIFQPVNGKPCMTISIRRRDEDGKNDTRTPEVRT